MTAAKSVRRQTPEAWVPPPKRVVVACARPFTVPSATAIRYAADLAEAEDAHLSVFTAIRPLLATLPEVVDAGAQIAEGTRGQLFAACVELLYDRPGLAWSVNVILAQAHRHLNALERDCHVVAVVHGGSLPDPRRSRLGRYLFSDFASRINAYTIRVATDVAPVSAWPPAR